MHLLRLFIALLTVTVSGQALATPFPGWHRLDGRLKLVHRGIIPPLANGTVPLFVKTTDVTATSMAILEAGGSIGTVSGDIMTATVPVVALSVLAEAPEIVAMEGGAPVKPRLDAVLPAIKADAVLEGAAPLASSYDGSGVLVGVVDYGLDLSHGAFTDPTDGTSRVIGLWDQGGTFGSPPSGYSYGSYCSSASIAAGTCAHSTDDDHGTHVTGIAAGAHLPGIPYGGVAPGASIAFVSLDNPPGYDDWYAGFTTSVCDGAAWIFAQADALGVPAVVNMSIGSHDGPHDGTSLASQCLDNLTGPGHIIVAAASNEGAGGWHPEWADYVYFHLGGDATADPQYAFFWMSYEVGDYWDENYLWLWFDDPADVQAAIGFMDWDGEWTQTDYIGIGDTFEGTLTVGDATVGPVSIEGGTTTSGSHYLAVIIQDGNDDGEEIDYDWYIEITGSGHFDVFMDTTEGCGFVYPDDAPFTMDNKMSVPYPGVAKDVIAVGSYVTKDEWQDIDGEWWIQNDDYDAQVVKGALSSYSSRGPSRNPAMTGQKPDIAAPGEIIASALSSSADYAGWEDWIVVGDDGAQDSYCMMNGTSMASPVMTGVVALLLEADPTLTVDGLRDLMDQTMVEDSFTGTLPNDDWGRGKIDAMAAISLLAPTVDPVDPSPEVVEEVASEDTITPPDTMIATDTSTEDVSPDVPDDDTVTSDTTVVGHDTSAALDADDEVAAGPDTIDPQPDGAATTPDTIQGGGDTSTGGTSRGDDSGCSLAHHTAPSSSAGLVLLLALAAFALLLARRSRRTPTR